MAADQLMQQLDELHSQSMATETSVEDIMASLHLSDRKEAVALLQRAERRGLGRFVLGRGSNKTRIIWKEVGESASVASSKSHRVPHGRSISSRSAVDYVFPLDENFDVTLRLPRDLTEAEAERIARFVSSLARDA